MQGFFVAHTHSPGDQKRGTMIRSFAILSLKSILKKIYLGKVRCTEIATHVNNFFKLIFENKNIKKYTGTNIALLLFAVSLIPFNKARSVTNEENIVTQVPTILTTKMSTQYPTYPIIISRGFQFYHLGIDFDAITGDPIYPIKTGKVEQVSHSGLGYGNFVIIDHGNELTSLYAHLSKINLEKDQEVTMDTVIGKVGTTGLSTGDHLHLEVRESNIPINPALILSSQQ